MFTQAGVKQLTDFLRTVTAASDLVDCTLVNCAFETKRKAGRYLDMLIACERFWFSFLKTPSINASHHETICSLYIFVKLEARSAAR